jgi:hypothetical protein
MSTVCRNCRVRVQRLQEVWSNTPISSGSRRRAPRALRPERGVTQSIPIDGLVATPWSAVDSGNCKSDPEAKIAAFLKVSCESRELSPALSRPHFFFTTVATGLKPGREHPSPFFFESDEMT